MEQHELRRRFATLTTAHVADACMRVGIPVRCAPALLRAVVPGSRLAGRALPARHVGSVDVFLEAFAGLSRAMCWWSIMADGSMRRAWAISWCSRRKQPGWRVS